MKYFNADYVILVTYLIKINKSSKIIWYGYTHSHVPVYKCINLYIDTMSSVLGPLNRLVWTLLLFDIVTHKSSKSTVVSDKKQLHGWETM